MDSRIIITATQVRKTSTSRQLRVMLPQCFKLCLVGPPNNNKLLVMLTTWVTVTRKMSNKNKGKMRQMMCWTNWTSMKVLTTRKRYQSISKQHCVASMTLGSGIPCIQGMLWEIHSCISMRIYVPQLHLLHLWSWIWFATRSHKYLLNLMQYSRSWLFLCPMRLNLLPRFVWMHMNLWGKMYYANGSLDHWQFSCTTAVHSSEG